MNSPMHLENVSGEVLAKMADQGKHPGWISGETFVIGNPRFGRLVQHVVWINPAGQVVYDQILTIEKGGAITVLVDQENRLGFVRVFRPVAESQTRWAKEFPNYPVEELGKYSLEFPRGCPKGDESVLETGAREAEEEGDRSIKSVKLLGYVCENTTFTPHQTGVICGHVSSDRSKFESDPDEALIKKIEWFTQEEIYQKIASGEIYCGLTLSSLMLYQACQSTNK